MAVKDEQLEAVLNTLNPTQLNNLTKAMVEGALDHYHSIMISIPDDSLKSPLDTWVIRKEIRRSWDALSGLFMWKWLMDNAIIDREHPGLPPVVQRLMTQNPELHRGAEKNEHTHSTSGPNTQDKSDLEREYRNTWANLRIHDMTIEDNQPLYNWKEDVLLKQACTHLIEHPIYEPMSPDASSALTTFGHALRRALMWVNEAPVSDRLGRLLDLNQTYGLNVITRDYLRYHVEVHGYTLTTILGIGGD